MNAIRTDKRVDEDRLPVLELGLDAVAAIDEPYKPVPDVNALRRQRPLQGRQQVGAMRLVPGEPESIDNRGCERGTHERAAVIPTALMECERPHTRCCQLVAEPQRVQNARRVRAHLDARTNLADRTSLLVHVHVKPSQQQGRRCHHRRRPPKANPPCNTRYAPPDGNLSLRARRSRPARA